MQEWVRKCQWYVCVKIPFSRVLTSEPTRVREGVKSPAELWSPLSPLIHATLCKCSKCYPLTIHSRYFKINSNKVHGIWLYGAVLGWWWLNKENMGQRQKMLKYCLKWQKKSSFIYFFNCITFIKYPYMYVYMYIFICICRGKNLYIRILYAL